MIAIFFRNLARDLIRQPLRTALTLSGVVWGTFSVILLIAFGDATAKAQAKRFHGMGQGIVLMFPSRTTLAWQGFLKGKPVRVTPEMVEEIPGKVPGIVVRAQRRAIPAHLRGRNFVVDQQFRSDLEAWMKRHSFGSIGEFEGLLSRERSAQPASFERSQYLKGISAKK